MDFIFHSGRDMCADCLILELKVGYTAEDAIAQIRDKNYIQGFYGKLGEKQRYIGRILAVGIEYDKITKKHECKVEILRERLK